jgi:Cation efflux family
LNIQLTARSSTSPLYTYGWHRAEILAALINGVFLLALCFSIFLEAIQRFFDIHGLSDYQNIAFMKTDLCLEISNPRLIIIVGSLGLASNIFGLFLFHGLLIALYLPFPCSNGKLKNMADQTDTPTNEFSPSPTVSFYLSPSQLLTRLSRTLTDIPQNTHPLYMAVQQKIASH